MITQGFLNLSLNKVESCFKRKYISLEKLPLKHNTTLQFLPLTKKRKFEFFKGYERRFSVAPTVVTCSGRLHDYQRPLSENRKWTFGEEHSEVQDPSTTKGTRSKFEIFAVGLAAVLLLSYLCLIRGNGNFSIMDATEPKFAVTAREMLQRGDWLTPQWNNRLRFDKPPLTYWLMAISYRLFGLSEFSTRLPTCLAGTLMAMAIYLAGWKFSLLPSTRCRFITGLVSSIIFLCNLFTIGWSRAGVSDMLLCFHTGAALLCFFTGYSLIPNIGDETYLENPLFPWNKFNTILAKIDPQNTKRIWIRTSKLFYWMFFVFCALAVLTKGPLGLFLPISIISLFLWTTENLKQVVLSEIPWIPGIISGSFICLPWYILIIQKHGWKFIQSFFGYHNMNRLTSAVNGHTGPFYYYLPISLIGFSPWIFLIPAAIAFYHPLEKALWKRRSRYRQFPLFLCIWVLFVYTFFSLIRTKLLSYVIPAVPAASLLLGVFFGRLHCLNEETDFAIPPKTTYSHEKSMSCVSDNLDKAQEMTENSKPSSEWSRNIFEERSKYIFQENKFYMKLFATLTTLWMFICSAFAFSVVQFVERATGDPVVLSLCIQKLRSQMFSWRGGIPWLLAGLFSFIQLTSKKEGTRYIRRMRWLFVPLSMGFLSFLLLFVQPAIKIWDSAWQQPLKELSQIAGTVSTNQKELYMLAYGQCDGDMEGQPSVVWYSQRNWKSHEDPKQFLANLAQENDPNIIALVEHRLWKKIPLEGTLSNDIETIAERGGFSLVRLSPEVAKTILSLWGSQ
ncbi:glycosyl transferase, family 39 [Galdieria sulphuraria]|uniref:Glycosyl transferase, family 39 n=1 Tax=Galdieria sulphuraria TaxID=130081 RepID=M2X0E8_GALSU|nr:glycosyl transferase, family 39 [Galdieria sulphuraria]EME29805.1 glycosyl transferase, family 39 [Galdieria sulphuraria]|eukprot:XP_005706325.1 glycosyl transferase, family 39 [Galdieria sulphuraria]